MLMRIHINVNVYLHFVRANVWAMKRRPRQRYHRGSVAKDALDAAAREIDLHGHQGFTLDRIAKRLGITPAALYRHYESREALLKAVVWETFVRFIPEMDDAVSAVASPREVVLALGTTYTSFALKNPGWFRLQFSQAGIALQLRHEQAEMKYPGIVLTAISTLLGTGEQERIMRTYLGFWALSHGVACLMMEGVWAHFKTDEERMRAARGIFSDFVDRLGEAPGERRQA